MNKNEEMKKENEKRRDTALKDEIRSVKEAIKLQEESKKNSRNPQAADDSSGNHSITIYYRLVLYYSFSIKYNYNSIIGKY